MDDVLRMAMIECLEQLLHILGSDRFSKCLVLLLRDLVEKGLSCDVLHHQIDVLLIVVRFVILDDVWVIQLVENRHFFHDAVDVSSQLLFVEHLDGNLEVLVMLVRREKHATECANTKNFRFGIDVVVLLEFVHSLLLVSLAHLNRLLLHDPAVWRFVGIFRDSRV